MSKPETNTIPDFRPSHINNQMTTAMSEGWGFDDFVMSPFCDMLSWIEQLCGCSTSQYSAMISPLQSVLGIPGAASHIGGMRKYYREGDYQEVTKEAALTTVNGAKSVMFLDAMNVSGVSQILHGAKTIFWGALCVYDGLSLCQNWKKLSDLKSTESKGALHDHHVALTYLNIVKSASIIAMGAIMLTSLLFAGIAHGILFSPVLFLGLSTSWIALNFATFIYEKMIGQWEAKLPTWSFQGPETVKA